MWRSTPNCDKKSLHSLVLCLGTLFATAGCGRDSTKEINSLIPPKAEGLAKSFSSDTAIKSPVLVSPGENPARILPKELHAESPNPVFESKLENSSELTRAVFKALFTYVKIPSTYEPCPEGAEGALKSMAAVIDALKSINATGERDFDLNAKLVINQVVEKLRQFSFLKIPDGEQTLSSWNRYLIFTLPQILYQYGYCVDLKVEPVLFLQGSDTISRSSLALAFQKLGAPQSETVTVRGATFERCVMPILETFPVPRGKVGFRMQNGHVFFDSGIGTNISDSFRVPNKKYAEIVAWLGEGQTRALASISRGADQKSQREIALTIGAARIHQRIAPFFDSPEKFERAVIRGHEDAHAADVHLNHEALLPCNAASETRIGVAYAKENKLQRIEISAFAHQACHPELNRGYGLYDILIQGSPQDLSSGASAAAGWTFNTIVLGSLFHAKELGITIDPTSRVSEENQCIMQLVQLLDHPEVLAKIEQRVLQMLFPAVGP